MEKVLFAADELTGLIGAAALMRPSKSVMDMEVSSVKKKFKDKRFAAGCSRDVIRQGAEMLGWELNELFEKTILANAFLRGVHTEGNGDDFLNFLRNMKHRWESETDGRCTCAKIKKQKFLIFICVSAAMQNVSRCTASALLCVRTTSFIL